jgi:hypothetical protein
MATADKARFSRALLAINAAVAKGALAGTQTPEGELRTVQARTMALQVQQDALLHTLEATGTIRIPDYERLLADHGERTAKLLGATPESGDAPAAVPDDAAFLSAALAYAVDVAADARGWLALWRAGDPDTLRELEAWMGQPDGATTDATLRIAAQPDLPGLIPAPAAAAAPPATPPPAADISAPRRRGRPPGKAKAPAAPKAKPRATATAKPKKAGRRTQDYGGL